MTTYAVSWYVIPLSSAIGTSSFGMLSGTNSPPSSARPFKIASDAVTFFSLLRVLLYNNSISLPSFSFTESCVSAPEMLSSEPLPASSKPHCHYCPALYHKFSLLSIYFSLCLCPVFPYAFALPPLSCLRRAIAARPQTAMRSGYTR